MGFTSSFWVHFHTIPSILKQPRADLLAIRKELFPYDSVYFKAREDLPRQRLRKRFPYDSVYFKAILWNAEKDGQDTLFPYDSVYFKARKRGVRDP